MILLFWSLDDFIMTKIPEHEISYNAKLWRVISLIYPEDKVTMTLHW